MKEYKRDSFKSDNKTYEIRILYEGKLVNIVAFFNNYPANGFRYQILIPKGVNVEELLKKDVFSHLLDTAKNDVKEKRWDRIKETFNHK